MIPTDDIEMQGKDASDGKQLLRHITNLVLRVRKFNRAACRLKDVYERMQGSAFNLMVSIAIISKLDEQVMAKLVLEQITANLWNAIVGTDQQYHLPVIMDRQRKMFLFHIQGRTHSALDHSNSKYQLENLSNITIMKHLLLRPGYIESQNLCDATLSEDVHRFDFNASSLSTGTFYASSTRPQTIVMLILQ